VRDGRRPHRIHHTDLLCGAAGGDRLPRALHGGSREGAAVDAADDLRGGGGHPGARLLRYDAALVPHHNPGQAAPPGGSLPRGQRDVPARTGALLRRTGRSHAELQPDGGEDPRPERRPAEEGAPTGGSVRQHDPHLRRGAGREGPGPVHDRALHPRGADGVRTGTALEMDEEELSNLERAAIFHDLGKIQTPADILLKEESLSPSEEEQMKSHLVDGTELLRRAPLLEQYIPVVRAHHEWYNGEGYPDRIRGTRSRSTPRSSRWPTPSTR